MTNTKIYHIYAKNTCLFHSVTEEEFEPIWKTLCRMVNLMETEYSQNDLSFEEITIKDNEFILNSSY